MYGDWVTWVWCVLLCAGFGAFGFWTGRAYHRWALINSVRKHLAGVKLWQHVPDNKVREKHVSADWGPEPLPANKNATLKLNNEFTKEQLEWLRKCYDNGITPGVPARKGTGRYTITPNEARKMLDLGSDGTERAPIEFDNASFVKAPTDPAATIKDAVEASRPKVRVDVTATPARDTNGKFCHSPNTLALNNVLEAPSYLKLGNDYWVCSYKPLSKYERTGMEFVVCDPRNFFITVPSPSKPVEPSLEQWSAWGGGSKPLTGSLCSRHGCHKVHSWVNMGITGKTYIACEDHHEELTQLVQQHKGIGPKEVVGFYPHVENEYRSKHCNERYCLSGKRPHTVTLKDGRVFKVCNKHIEHLHHALLNHGEYTYEQGTENA